MKSAPPALIVPAPANLIVKAGELNDAIGAYLSENYMNKDQVVTHNFASLHHTFPRPDESLTKHLQDENLIPKGYLAGILGRGMVPYYLRISDDYSIVISEKRDHHDLTLIEKSFVKVFPQGSIRTHIIDSPVNPDNALFVGHYDRKGLIKIEMTEDEKRYLIEPSDLEKATE